MKKLTDEKLKQLGFEVIKIDGQIFFKKGEFVLEKIFQAYLCKNPYTVVKTEEQLKRLM